MQWETEKVTCKNKIQSPYSLKLLAVNNGNISGFNIFLEFSGQQVFIAYHRHNGLLYSLLSNGITLGDLRRWKPKKTYPRKSVHRLCNTVKHLLRVTDEYLSEHIEEQNSVASNMSCNPRSKVQDIQVIEMKVAA